MKDQAWYARLQRVFTLRRKSVLPSSNDFVPAVYLGARRRWPAQDPLYVSGDINYGGISTVTN